MCCFFRNNCSSCSNTFDNDVTMRVVRASNGCNSCGCGCGCGCGNYIVISTNGCGCNCGYTDTATTSNGCGCNGYYSNSYSCDCASDTAYNTCGCDNGYYSNTRSCGCN